MSLADQINDILFTTWDPLDLNGNPNLSDEYADYALRLEDLIGCQDVNAFIRSLEVFEKELTLSSPFERKAQTAKLLSALKRTNIVH